MHSAALEVYVCGDFCLIAFLDFVCADFQIGSGWADEFSHGRVKRSSCRLLSFKNMFFLFFVYYLVSY